MGFAMSASDNELRSIHSLRHEIAPIELTRDTIGPVRETTPIELSLDNKSKLSKEAPSEQSASNAPGTLSDSGRAQ
jgi:hypothetical protein